MRFSRAFHLSTNLPLHRSKTGPAPAYFAIFDWFGRYAKQKRWMQIEEVLPAGRQKISVDGGHLVVFSIASTEERT